MIRLVKYLAGVIGRLLYTLVTLAVFLWLLFPADAVRGRLERELSRLLGGRGQVHIQSLTLALPPRVELEGIRVVSAKIGTEVARLDRLFLTPDLDGLWRGRKRVFFKGSAGGGTIAGTVRLDGPGRLHIQGRISGVKVEKAVRLDRLLERPLTGTLDLEGACTGAAVSLDAADCRGAFTVRGAMIPLRRELLGLTRLRPSLVQGKFTLKNGRVDLREGRAESRMFAATFSGQARLRLPPSAITLKAEGRLIPRPELFAHLGQGPRAAAVRRLAGSRGLPFLLNGTLIQPGLKLAGRSLASWEEIGRKW